MRRVVVTGAGAVSSIGNDWETAAVRLRRRENFIRRMPAWDVYQGLNTRLAGPVEDFERPAHMTRKQTRTMGRVALMAVTASESALRAAGLLDDPCLRAGGVGVAYGSSTGSTDAVLAFGSMLLDHNTSALDATTYIRMMSHTTCVNIGVHFGLTGRVLPTSSACTSGSQAIGYAYETIRNGYQTAMVAGGAEELCPTEAAVFDTLFATSTRNDAPQTTPRPFDRDRDGLVVGEGACTLILESLDHALARGARPLAEIVGFGSNADGMHVTRPNRATMQRCIELALADAELDPAAVGYVNAHATATEHGDIAESHAVANVFGGRMPISSLKSYVGHTLGACGALETWLTIGMLNEDWYAPTLNLEHVDERCAELDYLSGEGRSFSSEYAVSNNFAFGGINTSLVLRRLPIG